jgi:peptidoglycan LD-endopeptidase CwlK
MGFKLGTRSLERLKGVHPDLVKVVKLAIEKSEIDFTVGEGLRTIETQRKYVAEGKSKTMNSRHLTGHAVDLWPLVNGSVTWDWKYYYPMAEAMKNAAKELNIQIEWGGDWKSFKDGPHFQLPSKTYP